MNCQWKECKEPGTHALALNVPAVGCPIKEHEPIRIIIGLKCCLAHVNACSPKDFLTADGRLQKIVCFAAAGRAPPDFDRAFMSGVPLDSAEYAQYERIMKK